jgi:hypothetical protein
MEAQAKSIENEAAIAGRDRPLDRGAGAAAPALGPGEAAPGVRRGPARGGRPPGPGGPGQGRGGAARGERQGRGPGPAVRGRGVEGRGQERPRGLPASSSCAPSWRRRWRGGPDPGGGAHHRGRRRRPGLRRPSWRTSPPRWRGSWRRPRGPWAWTSARWSGEGRTRDDGHPGRPGHDGPHRAWGRLLRDPEAAALRERPQRGADLLGPDTHRGRARAGLPRGARRPRAARAVLRAHRQRGPHQHRHRHRGEGRVLQGRHTPERARRRQHQAPRRGAAPEQRHRALPGPLAPGDHGIAKETLGRKPARRAGPADAGRK